MVAAAARLAGCVRAVLLQDTRGWVARGRDPRHLLAGFAVLLAALPVLGRWRLALADAGLCAPNDGYRPGPCLLSGPFTGPTHMHVRGPAWLIVMFMLDAFQALTGIAPEALQNRCDDALAWLPADWQPL